MGALKVKSIAILVLASTLSACASTQIVSPRYIGMPYRASQESVDKAVRLALFDRHWTIEGQTQDHIIAEHSDRTQRLKIGIEFNAKSVTIEVMDLSPMPSYSKYALSASGANRWLDNLQKDIPILFERELILSSPNR